MKDYIKQAISFTEKRLPARLKPLIILRAYTLNGGLVEGGIDPQKDGRLEKVVAGYGTKLKAGSVESTRQHQTLRRLIGELDLSLKNSC